MKRSQSRIGLIACGIVVVFVLIATALAVLPGLVVTDPALSPAVRLSAKHDVRTEIIQAVGGLGALIGLLLVARQYRLAKETQVTQTYSAAAQLAGSYDIEHVLAGIFALERLARTSPSSRWDVERFFTEYLRHYYPWPIAKRVRQIGGRKKGDEPPRDEMAILRALAGRVPSGQPLDLRGVNLARCDLTQADLSGADLSGAYLGGADLSEATLEGVVLEGALDTDDTKWPMSFDRRSSTVLREQPPGHEQSSSTRGR
ncbi:pentapeptide repeat-containing protein [Rhodococcus koreensis]